MLGFRLIATTHCALILVQAALAGNYLDGGFDAISIHRANAGLVLIAGWAQAGAAALLWLRRRGPAWPLGASVLVCVAELLQAGAGQSRELSLHVPLGATLLAGTATLAAWSWAARPRAREGRA